MRLAWLFLLFVPIIKSASLEDFVCAEKIEMAQFLQKIKKQGTALISKTNDFIYNKRPRDPQELLKTYIEIVVFYVSLQSYITTNTAYYEAKKPIGEWGVLYQKNGEKIATYINKLRKALSKLQQIFLGVATTLDVMSIKTEALLPYVSCVQKIIEEGLLAFLSANKHKQDLDAFVTLPQLCSLWGAKLLFLESYGNLLLEGKSLFFPQASLLEIMGERSISHPNKKIALPLKQQYSCLCEQIKNQANQWRNFRVIF